MKRIFSGLIVNLICSCFVFPSPSLAGTSNDQTKLSFKLRNPKIAYFNGRILECTHSHEKHIQDRLIISGDNKGKLSATYVKEDVTGEQKVTQLTNLTCVYLRYKEKVISCVDLEKEVELSTPGKDGKPPSYEKLGRLPNLVVALNAHSEINSYNLNEITSEYSIYEMTIQDSQGHHVSDEFRELECKLDAESSAQWAKTK